MKKLTPRWLIIKLTGIFFAAYAAYNIFIIVRDHSGMTAQAIFISCVVALMFSLLSAYALTFGVMMKKPWFLMVRRMTFIITLLTVFLLKLRMIGRVITYLDTSKAHTVLYCAAYAATQAALLILLIYYIIIRKRFLFFPKACVILPVSAAILFLCGFTLEVILFFAYDIYLEASFLRTIVIRPVFYLGFIGLSVYYLFLPNLDTNR